MLILVFLLVHLGCVTFIARDISKPIKYAQMDSIDVNDIEMYYHSLGKSQNPPLIFLHGSLAFSELYKKTDFFLRDELSIDPLIVCSLSRQNLTHKESKSDKPQLRRVYRTFESQKVLESKSFCQFMNFIDYNDFLKPRWVFEKGGEKTYFAFLFGEFHEQLIVGIGQFNRVSKPIEEDNLKHKKIDKELSQKIQKARLSKGLTQKQLANRLSIPVNEINEMECGKFLYNGQKISKVKRCLSIK